MQRRAREFEEMSKKDGVGVPDCINLNLWFFAISPFIVYASLRKLPFKTPLFKGRWIECLAYTSVLKRIKQLERCGLAELAKPMQDAYFQQLKQNHVNPLLIEWMAILQFKIIIPLKFIFRWQRSLTKRIKKPLKEQVFSENPKLFPDLEAASKQVLPLYRKTSSTVVKI